MNVKKIDRLANAHSPESKATSTAYQSQYFPPDNKSHKQLYEEAVKSIKKSKRSNAKQADLHSFSDSKKKSCLSDFLCINTKKSKQVDKKPKQERLVKSPVSIKDETCDFSGSGGEEPSLHHPKLHGHHSSLKIPINSVCASDDQRGKQGKKTQPRTSLI